VNAGMHWLSTADGTDRSDKILQGRVRGCVYISGRAGNTAGRRRSLADYDWKTVALRAGRAATSIMVTPLDGRRHETRRDVGASSTDRPTDHYQPVLSLHILNDSFCRLSGSSSIVAD